MKLRNNEYYLSGNICGIYIQVIDKIAYLSSEGGNEFLRTISPKKLTEQIKEADLLIRQSLDTKRLEVYAASFEKTDIDKTIL